MPLALIVDDITSVPEAFRTEYTEKDGKHHLNVDGLEDTSGLKSALLKEREANKKAKADAAVMDAKVKKWESLGKTDAEIQEMLDKAAVAEQEAAKKSGNYDALLADQRKKADEAAKMLRDKYDSEKLEIAKELDAARASERSAIVSNNVQTALTKMKATSEGLDLLTERLGRRLTIETVEGKRVVQIMQADGVTPMAGSGADGTATVDDLVKEAVKNYPSLFEGSGAGGSGTDPKGTRREAGAKVLTRANFERLGPLERAVKMREGFKVVD